MKSQHILAKGQSTKRWVTVSSTRLVQRAQMRTIIGVKVHVLSSQDVSGAKPVINQEPEEHSMLWLTAPEPFQNRMHLLVPKKQFINFG
jgi:hypothetical protein